MSPDVAHNTLQFLIYDFLTDRKSSIWGVWAGGPGRPGNLPEKRRASPPTLLEGFKAARAPKIDDLQSVKKIITHSLAACFVVFPRRGSSRGRPASSCGPSSRELAWTARKGGDATMSDSCVTMALVRMFGLSSASLCLGSRPGSPWILGPASPPWSSRDHGEQRRAENPGEPGRESKHN